MPEVFTRIHRTALPTDARADATGYLPATEIVIHADGEIPFPQVIVRTGDGRELALLRDDAIANTAPGTYVATIPAGLLRSGVYTLQVEGCRQADIGAAGPEDWIKVFVPLEVMPPPQIVRRTDSTRILLFHKPKLYFGIHKHMHQPYYRAADTGFWDGMCDDIFATRAGPYRHFVAMAARQYAALPTAGLSMSWSGSLIEQLNRAGQENLAHNAFAGDWKAELREATTLLTEGGAPRADFTAFGYFHPLMPLIPARDIVRQIRMHQTLIRDNFGTAASSILFPPETAFHVRMIPALLESGVTAVVYDSIHRYRACAGYPYAGREEGMLPPNPAEQENPPAYDWLQLHNVWAGSKIAPSLLRPEYVKYQDVDGTEYRIIGIPAERYLGNEDARGGFGALVYPDVLGQVLESVERSGCYDPEHPPFFLLHSDGDNYGGGTDSYYGSNTGQLVEWLQGDPRFELTSIRDYLQRFPPDPDTAVHLEPGSWSGADNGDPQFMKWFSGYASAYSPDLNSWAILTALQNAVHTMLDICPEDEGVRAAERLLLTAETSCYWYWTGQEIWDRQVTEAANRALAIIANGLNAVVAAGRETTGPTIFPPWVTPENPGGETWGNNCLQPADATGTVHTLIYDVSGIRSARLFLRPDAGRGKEVEVPLVDRGPYPSQTGPTATASHYQADLPPGAGDVRYWLEAVDSRGNHSRSSLERIFLA
ncbi:MAG: glycosyl hydrolase family 57 [Planctomycetes bacterium]|nr:glycosyl hydrolase family 57 [Planctomycetota bacterium]